jgi:transcriptional regulator with XRE-family HTH domain
MAKKLSQQLTDQIREAIDASGKTRYRIAKETDIDQSALAKFYNGHRTLSMEALDRLGEFLKLEITIRHKGK